MTDKGYWVKPPEGEYIGVWAHYCDDGVLLHAPEWKSECTVCGVLRPNPPKGVNLRPYAWGPRPV